MGIAIFANANFNYFIVFLKTNRFWRCRLGQTSGFVPPLRLVCHCTSWFYTLTSWQPYFKSLLWMWPNGLQYSNFLFPLYFWTKYSSLSPDEWTLTVVNVWIARRNTTKNRIDRIIFQNLLLVSLAYHHKISY